MVLEKLSLTIGLLAVFFVLEALFPFYGERKEHGAHTFRHILFALVNTLLLTIIFVLLISFVDQSSFGIFHYFALPFWIEAAIFFLVIDLWFYLWHRMNHSMGFLWNFHQVHHADKEMDGSTAFRFHIGEHCGAVLFRLAVMFLLGAGSAHLLVYEFIFLPVIVFHHSNVRIPEWFDKVFRFLFASPHMHRIHHDERKEQADHNYGSVFSFWDRLFGTFKLVKDPHAIKLGLDYLPERKWQEFWGLFSLPFRKKK